MCRFNTLQTLPHHYTLPALISTNTTDLNLEHQSSNHRQNDGDNTTSDLAGTSGDDGASRLRGDVGRGVSTSASRGRGAGASRVPSAGGGRVTGANGGGGTGASALGRNLGVAAGRAGGDDDVGAGGLGGAGLGLRADGGGVDDGDRGGRCGDVGRRNVGAGGRGSARGHGGGGAGRGGHGRGAVAALAGGDGGGHGRRADGGVDVDGGGDDLLGEAAGAVGDRGSAAGDGVDGSGGDGARNHARVAGTSGGAVTVGHGRCGAGGETSAGGNKAAGRVGRVAGTGTRCDLANLRNSATNGSQGRGARAADNGKGRRADVGADIGHSGTDGKRRRADVGNSGTHGSRDRGARGADTGGRRGAGADDAGVVANRADLGALSWEADINASASGKGDEDGRSKVEVENIADGSVELNGNTSNERKGLLAGDRALVIGVDLDQGGCVVEQVDPYSHLSTGADVKAKDVQTGLDADGSAQAEAESQIDSNLEIDISTQGNGESLSNKTLTVTELEGIVKERWVQEHSQVGVDDLLGQEADLDKCQVRQCQVDTSLNIDGSGEGKSEVKPKSDSSIYLEQTGKLRTVSICLTERMIPETHGQVETGRSEKLNRCGNSSAGLKIHLKIDLDATQVDLDCWVDQELVGDLDRDGTGDVGLCEAEDEVDLLLDTGNGWRDDTTSESPVSTSDSPAKHCLQILPLVKLLVNGVLGQLEGAWRHGPGLDGAGANILGNGAGLREAN